MPEPLSARSVSRVSNWGTSAMCSRISSGIPKSASTVRRTSLSAGSLSIIEITPLGRASVRRLSMRKAIWGAWAALANSFMAAPTRWDFGLVRWKACPSPSGRWAMWSIALATKSTGTTLV